MKLLLDANLSRRIVSSLQADYPGSTQVALAGLETADDRRIWEFAKANDFVIVTKDEDFIEIQSILGFPPKVVKLAMGNCTNEQILAAISRSREEIESALSRQEIGFVEVL